jgi:hypothetical protein
MKTQTYKVDYTKKIGGTGSILVKAESIENALMNAKNLCATGSDFRNAALSNEEYQKPRKQGFAGRN